ncbi:DNA-formamidopyrimidine glycosylase [Silvibacterium dinghuense]|uniref:Formamidopyrimidine-DNA glycosylase n=1 Tax=Silvibacterium dinghuense TaxID=1560006 RepID=A0A4V1NW32_9BACT|nr:DNA-formamidopyrimidine glycosylase [Silvibacterium dinghuense]RXS98012.1 bifunctional DNA-formamidopyrimidine glycosylase/DNA-(apurinic or apyrimidinic site) lyase [Silvibacterium dinghuense]GGH03804.1 formamidopyrimidine-DNA glycosylase [Silvibacterium dinghuense]
MPELPEVETVANGVHERIRGERIEGTWFSGHREPFKASPQAMAEALAGRRVARVYRVGKHIVMDLAVDGAARHTGDGTPSPARIDVQWIVHLGMTGRLLVSAASVPVPAHTHAVLQLSSGRELRFVDARRFGRLDLRQLDENQGPGGQGFAGPGHEPLTIGAEDFARLFHGRRLSIKAALLNQKLLHGVGNIYADESLFHAGIRPTRMAGRLTRAQLEALRMALQEVLRHAISLGGSSVSDYVDADGVAGFFQLEHRVYMRTGEPCRVCKTAIKRTIEAGRGTHYCPHCQK